MGGELFLCTIYFHTCGWRTETSLIKIFVCFDFFKSWNNYCDGAPGLICDISCKSTTYHMYPCLASVYFNWLHMLVIWFIVCWQARSFKMRASFVYRSNQVIVKWSHIWVHIWLLEGRSFRSRFSKYLSIIYPSKRGFFVLSPLLKFQIFFNFCLKLQQTAWLTCSSMPQNFSTFRKESRGWIWTAL